MPQVPRDQLDAALDHIRAAPHDQGRLAAIVRRPRVDDREVLEAGELSTRVGLVGDTWTERSSRRSDDGGPHPDMQVTLINARAIAAMAPDPADRWAAGDQLHVDLDLSEEGLPAGTRLRIGAAVIEITDQPHTGCAKFSTRYGVEALRWVNGPEGRALRLRGANARVVHDGTIRAGDAITRATPSP